MKPSEAAGHPSENPPRHPIRSLFGAMEIRYKFLLSFALIFFLSMLMCSLFIYAYVRHNIEDRIESELTNTTQMIYHMVTTSVNVSIKNHLRAAAEKNRDIVAQFHRRYMAGEFSEKEAQERAGRVILSQSIGSSGYLYCLDSQGGVPVHPRAPVSGSNVAGHAFVRQMAEMKEGYLEYEWKNPGEETARPKALFMSYFKPWDWIIAASAYRSEFIKLVNVEDFRESILSLKFGKSGYAFVIDKDARALIHPRLQGINIFKTKELPNQHLEDMMVRKKGRSVYHWKNPGEDKARPKLVMFNSIPEYEWIVAASSYLDELYAPLSTIRNVILGIFLVFFFIMLAVTFGISHGITTPLGQLTARFKAARHGDYTTRMFCGSKDEIGQLAGHFNEFMDQLETTHKDLNNQIRERQLAEQKSRESRERYYLLMEAAPDPIVNYDMEGRVIYINPAFTRVFGWEPEECTGRKMDHFVPGACWPETRTMIQQVISGDGIFNVETRRYTRDGRMVDVSISGASVFDAQKALAGSIIILRDITRSKTLEKQVMQVGDRERMNIGHDLHDDLCPHLIGISGLAAVLRDELGTAHHPSAGLAGQMGELMADAVDKTRQLARGLCPVHLVAHGFQGALEEIATQFSFHPGMTVECHLDPGVEIRDNTRAIHLYHIAREAVNNAVKHSGAGCIQIILEQEKGSDSPCPIHLRIRDNGQGMDPPHVQPPGPGIGLQIMAYRAKIIDAQFHVHPLPRGTEIQVSLIPKPALKKEVAHGQSH